MSFVPVPKDRIHQLVRHIRSIPTDSTVVRERRTVQSDLQRAHWLATVVAEARTFHVLRAKEFRILRSVLRRGSGAPYRKRRAANQLVALLYDIRTTHGPFSQFSRKAGPSQYALLRLRMPKRHAEEQRASNHLVQPEVHFARHDHELAWGTFRD